MARSFRSINDKLKFVVSQRVPLHSLWQLNEITQIRYRHFLHVGYENPDLASPTLLRYWRHFEPGELYPVRYARGSGVRTLITADQQEDRWHVCFMQDWNSPGARVAHTIERLASVIYWEACATARQPMASSFSRWLAHSRVRRRPEMFLDPSGFHFYQHIPPNPDDCRETFERVALRFEGSECRDPD